LILFIARGCLTSKPSRHINRNSDFFSLVTRIIIK
jgi:hypothetical protein